MRKESVCCDSGDTRKPQTCSVTWCWRWVHVDAQELPNSYKLNFAMALLLAGHPSGCQDILAEINDEQHPTVIALRAIKRWVSDLSFWQRVNWWTGKIEPSICHPTIDFLPGDLGLDVELAPPTPIASTSSHHNTAL